MLLKQKQTENKQKGWVVGLGKWCSVRCIQLQASKRRVCRGLYESAGVCMGRVCADVLIKGLGQVTALGDVPIRGGCPPRAARGEGWGAGVLPNSSLLSSSPASGEGAL